MYCRDPQNPCVLGGAGMAHLCMDVRSPQLSWSAETLPCYTQSYKVLLFILGCTADVFSSEGLWRVSEGDRDTVLPQCFVNNWAKISKLFHQKTHQADSASKSIIFHPTTQPNCPYPNKRRGKNKTSSKLPLICNTRNSLLLGQWLLICGISPLCTFLPGHSLAGLQALSNVLHII